MQEDNSDLKSWAGKMAWRVGGGGGGDGWV